LHSGCDFASTNIAHSFGQSVERIPDGFLKPPPIGSELDSARMPREQRFAEMHFECCNVSGDCAMRDVQLPSGTRKAAVPRRGIERL
jgi:hypothetical protein